MPLLMQNALRTTLNAQQFIIQPLIVLGFKMDDDPAHTTDQLGIITIDGLIRVEAETHPDPQLIQFSHILSKDFLSQQTV
ncbi:hypothetical protein ABDK09_14350 [Vibrio sp. CDRSL-10 TSBA]